MKLDQYLHQTHQITLKKKERDQVEIVRIARMLFKKGLISGMDLGLIAYRNNQLAF